MMRSSQKLNEALHSYYSRRCFETIEQADDFFARCFLRRKTLYFDEVENANVWSFYLVERDLHHTFEEYLAARRLPPYAIWSRPNREASSDDIGRATFPISETSAIYRKPVPVAGQSIDYTLEVLKLDECWAIFGFLGYLVDFNGQRSLHPSVATAWLRFFVRYVGEERRVVEIPVTLKSVLEADLARDGWS